MENLFTNVLLSSLLALVGTIAMIFYKKMDEMMRDIKNILISDMSMTKDIEQLKNDRDDHEERITNLEDKI